MEKYPEPGGGETRISKEIDTHRVLLEQTRPVPKTTISSPEDVKKLVSEMADYDRERFKVVFLDTKNRVIGIENIAEGTINAALIHPRETVKGAILQNAAGVVFAHNHPSGIPTPSREDDVLIDKLIEAFGFLGIDVIDAIIIGKEGLYSYKEAGKSFKPMLIGGIMEGKPEDDKCSVAIRAAMSVISEQCGEGEREVDIGGVKIKVMAPESVMQVMEEPLTREQRITAIQDSSWAQGEATGLCTKLFGVVPGAKEYADCIQRVSRKLAEGMVGAG